MTYNVIPWMLTHILWVVKERALQILSLMFLVLISLNRVWSTKYTINNVAGVHLNKSLLKQLIICGIKYKITKASVIHSVNVRRMQNFFFKSTNFSQSQWVIGDLSTQ